MLTYAVNKTVAPSNKLASLGIELEVEGRNLPSEGDLARVTFGGANWTTHRDGSLRGENYEYVLSKPLNIDDLTKMVEGLYNIFYRKNTTLTLSNRCSTHVHYNVGGCKINDITNMLVLWFTFEKALIRFCGEERTTNHFCLSYEDSPEVLMGWERAIKTGDFNFPEDRYKYAAINLNTLSKFGSLEVRTMRACTEPKDIIDWAKFINALFNRAKAFVHPGAIAAEISSEGPTNLFKAICKEADVSMAFINEVIGNEDDFYYSCFKSFRNAQPLIYEVEWEDLLPLIQKEYIENPFEGRKRTTRRRTREEEAEEFERIWVDEAAPAPAPAPDAARRTVAQEPVTVRWANIPPAPDMAQMRADIARWHQAVAVGRARRDPFEPEF